MKHYLIILIALSTVCVSCKKKSLKAEDYVALRTNIRAHIETFALIESFSLQTDFNVAMGFLKGTDTDSLTFDSLYFNSLFSYKELKLRKGNVKLKYQGKLSDTNNVFYMSFNYKRDSMLVSGNFTIKEVGSSTSSITNPIRKKKITGTINFTYINGTKASALVNFIQVPKTNELYTYTGNLDATDALGNLANTSITIPLQNVSFQIQSPDVNPIRIGFGECKLYTTQQGNGRIIFGYVKESNQPGYYDDNAYIEFPDKNDLQLNLDMRGI
jgi:hypothetical protein